MAVFRCNIEPVKRSAGQQATGAAAYRAGETIRDERTGTVHNHSKRRDVRHAEIFLPSRFGEAPMEWARNRASLWNAAEAAEKRRTSRVAREFQVALPFELNPEQRLTLARSFAREVADRYGVAVDLAIHDPKPGPRESQNFHAHLLATTREVTPTGLGAKAGLDMGAVLRAQQGLVPHAEEYSAIRERWANLMNEAFQAANLKVRVDHRSLAAQGIDRKPLLHIPLEFYQLERQGMPKEVAERLRAGYRARMEAYLERSRGEQAGSQQERTEERTRERTERTQERTQEERTRAPGEQRTPSHEQTRDAHVSPPLEHAHNQASPERQTQPRDHRAISQPEHTREQPEQARARKQHDAVQQDHASPQQDHPAPQQEHSAPKPEPIPSRNAAEIRRRAVQEWLQMRSKEAQSSQDRGAAKETTTQRDREDGRER